MKTTTMSSATSRWIAAVLSLGVLSLTSIACTASSDDDAAAEDGVSSADALTGSVAAGGTLTTTTRVNLRTGPSTSDEILRTLASGVTVKAIDPAPTNGFYHVSHEGTEGWVYGAYLKNSGGETTPTGGDDDPPPVTGTFNGRTYSGVTVLWQGNWSFLVKCDSYSRSKGHVVFFCDENPSRSFVDDGAWLAMPRANFSSGSCGKKARVCKGTQCIVATIVEKSETTGRWEGSSAVLKALGVSTGYSGCSSSFGTASGVTITMQ